MWDDDGIEYKAYTTLVGGPSEMLYCTFNPDHGSPTWSITCARNSVEEREWPHCSTRPNAPTGNCDDYVKNPLHSHDCLC